MVGRTIASERLGLMLAFGTIPNVGERVEAHGWRFEIADLDGRRIDKVLATPASDLAA